MRPSRFGAIQVPFQFGIAQRPHASTGWFFNGEQRVMAPTAVALKPAICCSSFRPMRGASMRN
jgi:hypothetical protein